MRKRIQMSVDTRTLAHARDLMYRMGLQPEIKNGVESPSDIIRTMMDLALIVYNGADYYAKAPSYESQSIFESETIPKSNRHSQLISAAAGVKTEGFPQAATGPTLNNQQSAQINSNIKNKIKNADPTTISNQITQINDNNYDLTEWLDWPQEKIERSPGSKKAYATALALAWFSQDYDSPEEEEISQYWEIDRENDILIANENNPLKKE